MDKSFEDHFTEKYLSFSEMQQEFTKTVIALGMALASKSPDHVKQMKTERLDATARYHISQLSDKEFDEVMTLCEANIDLLASAIRKYL